MNKPLVGILVGGILGVFDGLSALLSAPEVAPQIMGIVLGSTFKGLLVGLIMGFFARKVENMTLGLVIGGLVGLFFAGLIVYMGIKAGEPAYYWEIMLPGSIVGLIVGYATQKYGRPAAATYSRETAAR